MQVRGWPCTHCALLSAAAVNKAAAGTGISSVPVPWSLAPSAIALEHISNAAALQTPEVDGALVGQC